MADDPKGEPQRTEPGKQGAPEKERPSPSTLTTKLEAAPPVISKDCTEQNKNERWERKRFRVEVVTLIIIFCYTAIAGYQGYQMRKATEAARRSADATKEAVKVAQDTLAASREGLRLEQRAWVGIPEVVVDDPKQTSDSVSYKGISLILRNSGRTPAINSQISYTLISSSGSEPPLDFDKITKYVGRWPKEWGVIWQPPKPQGVFTPGETYPIIISPPSVHRGQDRPRMVYIMGKITYNDIFPSTAQRTTKFCFEYRQFFPDYRFTPCPEGNRMD